KFTGHERDLADPNGPGDDLDYLHVRQSNPLTGRFLSCDPLGGNSARPQTWNRYAYALGNPLKYVDPSGLEACGTDMCITVTGSPLPNDSTDLSGDERFFFDSIFFNFNDFNSFNESRGFVLRDVSDINLAEIAAQDRAIDTGGGPLTDLALLLAG